MIPGRRDVGDLDRVVLGRVDRVGEVLPDLLGVDVERRDELHVADVVLAELDVHETGYEVRRVSVLVVLDALDQGRGAVAHAHDGHANLAHPAYSLALVFEGVMPGWARSRSIVR